MTADTDMIDIIKNSPSLKPSYLKISDLNWKFAVRSVLRGDNLLILGESGFGKTLLASILPSVLNRPFFNIPMGHTNDPRSLLVGNTHFNAERGTFVVDSKFVHAIQTPNAVILLDELSRAHPSAHNMLMPVLDKKQRRFELDTRPDTPVVEVAEGVSFIMTANVGTEYTATRTMDRALLDRCMILLMPVLTKEQEIELLTETYPSLSARTIEAVAEIADETRQQVKSDAPKLSTQISTRITMDMCALMCDGFTLDEAAQVFVYPLYTDAGGVDSERTYITQKVQFYVDGMTMVNVKPVKERTGPNPNGTAKRPFP